MHCLGHGVRPPPRCMVVSSGQGSLQCKTCTAGCGSIVADYLRAGAAVYQRAGWPRARFADCRERAAVGAPPGFVSRMGRAGPILQQTQTAPLVQQTQSRCAAERRQMWRLSRTSGTGFPAGCNIASSSRNGMLANRQRPPQDLRWSCCKAHAVPVGPRQAPHRWPPPVQMRTALYTAPERWHANTGATGPCTVAEVSSVRLMGCACD